MNATKTQSAAFDETVARAALAYANTNVLRIALLQATGDPELARMQVVKQSYWAGAYEVPALSPEHDETVRDKAIAFLKSGARPPCDFPDEDSLRRLMALMTGGPVEDWIFQFGQEELNLEPMPRGAAWNGAAPEGDRRNAVDVVIIGAGAAGLVTAIQLKRLGIPFTIIERNADVGGTWWTNDYPDARVDIPSHHYQLTVTQAHPWRHWFAPQQELLEYLRGIADQFELRPHIRFNTELTEATWDESASAWNYSLRTSDGMTETNSARVLVSAAGLFNEPNMPDIVGIETFGGRIFHTTNWEHDFDYGGKRVGIIGVGCTGAQLMPAIARKAAQVDIFQRSPHWVSRLEGYRDEIPSEIQWLLANVPYYWNWHCFNVFYTLYGDDGSLQQVDREWMEKGGRINAKNDRLCDTIRRNIYDEFPDDPAFAEKLMPNWPPFAKRLVVDNGWFDALKEPHVSLVTEGIDCITEAGIVTNDGVLHELDLIVAAGGFKAERYLWPVQYKGRGGITLEQAWNYDGARTYLGVTMPDFPNMFIVYGPNMNPRAGGLFAWLEIWSRYAVQAIAHMVEGGHKRIACREDSYAAYNRRLDEAQDSCIWGLNGIKSYYINEQGRQIVNNPLRPSEAYSLVRNFKPADYELT